VRDFAKGALKFLGAIAAVLLVAGAILYAFFVEVVEVGHNGMSPTMMLGDRVLVWKTTEFELGEAILCPHPSQRGRFVLGRVVGRPGQTVSMDRGTLLINGDSPDRDLHAAIAFDDRETGRRAMMVWGDEDILDHDHRIWWRERSTPEMGRPRRVRGGLFLLSDNRTYRGEDSRSFGEVPAQTCIGRVFMRLTAEDSPAAIGNAPLDIIE
jgi:signal peptidase I